MRTCAQFCAGFNCAGAVLLSASASAQNLYVAAGDFQSPVLPIENASDNIYLATPGENVSIFANNAGDIVRGLTFNESGNLFALTAGPDGSVIQITPGGARNTYASGLSAPFDLAFNSSGSLFVSEGGTATVPEIVEITPGGGTATTFATGLIDPRGLAFNSAGDLFVADATSNILEFTQGGTKTLFATGLADPFGLAFNSAGNLFVADAGSGDITEITPDGTESTYATGLDHPRYITFDSSGDLFVSNLGTAGADGVDNNGYLTEIMPNGTKTNFDEGFIDLSGLAISPAPEPSATGLIVIGIVGLFIRRRRVLHATYGQRSENVSTF